MVSNAIHHHTHHTHHPGAGLHQVTTRNNRNYTTTIANPSAMLSSSYYAAAAAIVNNQATNHLLIHHPDYSTTAALLAPNAAALAHHMPQNYLTNNNQATLMANGFHAAQHVVNQAHLHQVPGAGLSQSHPNGSSPNTTNNNNNNSSTDLPPDRPIGYGAFGVVWSVTDPRDGKVVALKKIPNIFQNLISSRRVFREIRMLCFFKHENVLSALDILQPPSTHLFHEIYVISELMQSDLHKIIVSSQPLTGDHVKVFLYQILRGLKYLHSAKILHRDIKPGNLLVNSNCLLKICDFGLARVEEPNRNRHMTQEVVTQYYRAPELLMGARYYTEAIDIWSVGCIFAELLGRRILFQAQSPLLQLDLILELLGTPSQEDMKYACDAARVHVLRGPYQMPTVAGLYNLSSYTNSDAVHLLCQMLAFNPDKRISATAALNHLYVSEGRARYHSCMCKCCFSVGDSRRYAPDLEPEAPQRFDNLFEKDLTSVAVVKDRLHKEIMQKCMSSNRVPLCINPLSASFKTFASSSVAHPSELPPSPHCWE